MGKRDEILVAAIELFATYGYHKTTMDQIANEANVAKGTLYWHFSSKRDLFMGILQSDIEKYFTFLEKLRDDKKKTSREKVETLLGQRFTFLHERQSIFREVMNQQEGIDQEFKMCIGEMRQRHVDLLTGIFAEGVARDEFVIADPKVVAIAFMGMNIAITSHQDLVAEEQQSETVQVLEELIFSGILGEK